VELHSQKMIDFLKTEIRTKHLKTGSRLPSIISLSRKFRLTAGQVRYGFSLLKKEGLVVSRHGKGFFVANQEPGEKTCHPLVVALDLFHRKFDFYDDIIYESILSELGGVHSLQSIIPLLPKHRSIQALHPDAVIFSKAKTDHNFFQQWSEYSRRHRIPVLFLNRFPPQKNLSYLAVDFRQECCRVVSRMLKNGARNIVFYQYRSCLDYPQPMLPRLEGFRDAYALCGLKYPEELMIRDDSIAEQTRFVELLQSGKADVLFCAYGSDLINAVSCAVSAGISLQNRLPIFCFDDVGFLAERMNLPVSFIRMPLARMARIATNYILRKAVLPNLPPIRETFEAAVYVKSCKFLV
jgi:hypothetical protein